MKNPIKSIYLSLLCLAMMSFTGLTPTKSPVYINITLDGPLTNSAPSFESNISSLYNKLEISKLGLSIEAFEQAYKGYKYLLDKNKLSNPGILTICDFSQSSKQKRFYLIDMINNKVITNTWVAHGKNSGVEYANKFSNKPESLQSSLGFYVTGQTYQGAHGLSLRVNGMEPGFNDKAYQRAIVIHGAAYIGGNKSFMGRSFGCPAVPQKESATIINKIKNGTCLFIYHPAKNYLKASKILNG